jgi:hypothetical protein
LDKESPSSETAAVTLPGTVEKIIKSADPTVPDKAQIVVEGADHLYREIRIENILQNADGERVRLEPGTEVDVTVEAPVGSTVKHSDEHPKAS